MNNFNQCLNDLFKNDDLKSKMNINEIKIHNNKENAWITLNNKVYSLKNNDFYLLEIFKEYYGSDVKDYLINNFNNKERILIINELKKRIIGKLY
tara:strand:- start:260 stop:544 length:285 start_codon:yes stop_codon:yes gene_type:complete